MYYRIQPICSHPLKIKFYGLFLIILSLFLSNCKKKEASQPVQETGTVTDHDGNVYKTVKIGHQWWMAENLKVTRYNDGTFINRIQTDATQWEKDTLGAYCAYDDNSSAPGFLYNWYVINSAKKIAPNGWHVPSDDEWKELEYHLGMSQEEIDKTSWRGTDEGEKLKVKAPAGWSKYGDVWGNNESGFTALAGSCRLFNGTWGNPGLFSTGFWWTSTANENQAWYRYMDYKNKNVFRHYSLKNYGFSIRCVKD